MPQHLAAKFCTRLFVTMFRVPQLQYKILTLQVKHVAEAWQWGYRSVCFLARESFLYLWGGLDKARAIRWCRPIQYHLAANFISRVGTYRGIVEPFIDRHLCNHSPSIFGAWAASSNRHLPRTIQYVVYIIENSYYMTTCMHANTQVCCYLGKANAVFIPSTSVSEIYP